MAVDMHDVLKGRMLCEEVHLDTSMNRCASAEWLNGECEYFLNVWVKTGETSKEYRLPETPDNVYEAEDLRQFKSGSKNYHLLIHCEVKVPNVDDSVALALNVSRNVTSCGEKLDVAPIPTMEHKGLFAVYMLREEVWSRDFHPIDCQYLASFRSAWSW